MKFLTRSQLLPALQFALVLLGSGFPITTRAQDMPLSDILVSGEGWQVVAEGYQFTDACTADAEGNFYFADVAKGDSIHRVTPNGQVSALISGLPRISGMKFGPDGRIYACTQAPKKQVVAIEVSSGKLAVLADNVQPNDLVVTHRGGVYFTETGKHQVTFIPPGGEARAVDVGIKAPNGITLSPDQGTLAVSDYSGTNVWTFRIERDGGLSAKAPYMTMRAPVEKPEIANGDGMTTDSAGRYYVTSALGVQIFDPTGRMSGVLSKPQNKGLVSCAFAGPHFEYLYVACTDKIYRRKTKATGVLGFQKPAPPAR